MKLIIGEARRGPLISSVVVVGALVLLALSVLTNTSVAVAAPVIAFIVIGVIGYETLLSWRWLLGLIILVILFIPIRRYSLTTSLPFNLEPYRLIVAFVALGWLTSLLIDPRVRLRRTLIDVPLFCFLFVVLIGLLVNEHRVGTVSGEVYKKLAFFASFFVVFYLIASVARHARDIQWLVRLLTGGGAVVAAFAVYESRTGYNVFNHLQGIIPFIHLDAANVPRIPERGARLRVFASAQHAIALGAMFAMLLPLAIYLARSSRRWYWWLAALTLVLGAFSTVSRTAMIMFVVEGVVFLWLRPREMKRLWPAFIPALLLIHLALPGTLGTIRASFFPSQGLVKEQSFGVGSGRLATLGPALDSEFTNPLVGEGFGTRVTKATELVPVPNGPILDDAWLGILLETGLLGTLSLVWMFLRFVLMVGREAKRDESSRGWLLASINSSVAAFAVGMIFFDAFSFIQVTFMMFILLGLGSAAYQAPRTEWATDAQRARRRVLPRPVPAAG